MNKKNNAPTRFDNILRTMIVFCFSFIILYVICGAIVSPDLDFFHETAHIYNEDWVVEYPDGTKETHKMPMSLDINDDEMAILYTVLPDDVEDGMYLAVNTGKSFSMSVDGEEIYNFNNTKSNLPGNITKTVIVPVPLDEVYADKQLTMTVTNGKYDRTSVNTAYIGNLMGIFLMLVRNFALQFVMAIILILASVTVICIFAYIKKRDNRNVPLIYLAEGIFAICLWIVFDSPLFQIVFRLYFFDGITGFMLVTTMALPFLLYFDALLENRHHKIFAIFETIIVINFIVLTMLHITGIRSYDRALIYVDLMLLVYIGVMIGVTFNDYVVNKNRDHRNVFIGLIGLSVFSFFEIIVTILSAKTPLKIDIGGLFVLTGMIILLFFAILDQVKVLDRLQQETQNALSATRAKSDFLANMSHEIRTPINAVLGMNEMILRESEEENVRGYANNIADAGKSLLSLVNDILDFSKIESGKMDIVCVEYQMKSLLRDLIMMVRSRMASKNLELILNIDENIPSVYFGDEVRIKQVLTNILTNSAKYTPSGSITLTVENRGIVNDEIELYFSVKDTGIGIKKEDIDKLMNSSFIRVDQEKNRNIEGTGLGVTITRQLLNLMGSKLELDSEYGKGSNFHFILKQKVLDEKAMGSVMSKSEKTAKKESWTFRATKARILAVDDTRTNLLVIKGLLKPYQCSVTTCESGEQCIELCKNSGYDLIFMDHMMPGINGIDTLKELRKDDGIISSYTKVIALTANAISGAADLYRENGFDGYLTKPIDTKELDDCLKSHLPKEVIEEI
ncbi:MAG: ATP-binding protein [Lachnospiraceae bacterium]|nr:ATP-binding protein [Lachnospiraceae bacterium]